MSIYKLYGTNSGSGDAVASLDIQFDGEIVGYSMFGHGDDLLSDEVSSAEVSFLSTSSFTSNDARGVIACHGIKHTFTTSGAGTQSYNVAQSGLSIPVVAGERMYLHLNGVAAKTHTASCILYVADQADVNIRRRR